MNYVGWMVLYFVGSLYVLWLFYLAGCALIRAKDNHTISLPAFVLGYPVIGLLALVDVLVNIFVMTILFLELPRQWLVTQRLSMWCCTEQDSWRKTVARWVCVKLLDTFDPSGVHCE
jgi:hypothetical protein